jgi:hypothetical protein
MHDPPIFDVWFPCAYGTVLELDIKEMIMSWGCDWHRHRAADTGYVSRLSVCQAPLPRLPSWQLTHPSRSGQGFPIFKMPLWRSFTEAWGITAAGTMLPATYR